MGVVKQGRVKIVVLQLLLVFQCDDDFGSSVLRDSDMIVGALLPDSDMIVGAHDSHLHCRSHGGDFRPPSRASSGSGLRCTPLCCCRSRSPPLCRRLRVCGAGGVCGYPGLAPPLWRLVWFSRLCSPHRHLLCVARATRLSSPVPGLLLVRIANFISDSDMIVGAHDPTGAAAAGAAAAGAAPAAAGAAAATTAPGAATVAAGATTTWAGGGADIFTNSSYCFL